MGTHLIGHMEKIMPRRRRRELEPMDLGQPERPLQLLSPGVFSPKVAIFVDRLELGELGGATYQVKLVALKGNGSASSSTTKKLGRLSHTGVVFQETKWFPTHKLLRYDLGIEILDCTVMSNECPQVLYRCTLPRNSVQPQGPLVRVSSLLQHPNTSHMGRHLRRLRHPDPVRVQLRPGDGRRMDRTPELLLNFWPAWDPYTVPLEQRWVLPHPEPPPASAQKPSKQGWLEKRATGSFHRWSRKWVVVANGELKYWNDKRAFDEEVPARVCLSVKDPACLWRFAPAPVAEGPDVFLQVKSDGRLEARWRASADVSNEGSAKAWLQTILVNSISA